MLTGSQIAATLGDNIAQREAAILDYVRKGNFVLEWVPMVVKEGPYTATFMVSADSLRLGIPTDSFRVGVTAATEQKIADELGATMMTPKLHDELYKQSKLKLSKTTTNDLANMSTMAVMKKISDTVDQKIADKLGWSLASIKPMLGGLFVSNEGKYWVNSTWVSNQGPIQHYGKPPLTGTFASENYGFYEPGLVGTTATPMQGVGVVQGPGHAHDYFHTDYSQVVRLARRNVNVCKDGVCRDVDIYQLAQDPELAPLVNHQRVAMNMRHPRVPWNPSTAAVALWQPPSTLGTAAIGGWGNWGKPAATTTSVVNRTPPPLLPPRQDVVAALVKGDVIPFIPGVKSGGIDEIATGALLVGAGVGIGWLAAELIG